MIRLDGENNQVFIEIYNPTNNNPFLTFGLTFQDLKLINSTINLVIGNEIKKNPQIVEKN